MRFPMLKPLVAWVVDAVKKAKSLDDVIVATDDTRIVEAVEAHGGRAVMTPSELPSGTDRIACAARNFLGADFAAAKLPPPLIRQRILQSHFWQELCRGVLPDFRQPPPPCPLKTGHHGRQPWRKNC